MILFIQKRLIQLLSALKDKSTILDNCYFIAVCFNVFDDFGYNARTDEYVHMFEVGVIDPTKVARVALENAASVAGMFLTTECGIVDIPEQAPADPAMPADGMM